VKQIVFQSLKLTYSYIDVAKFQGTEWPLGGAAATRDARPII